MPPKRSPSGRSRSGALGSPSEILDRLQSQHPNAWTELNFANPYELLVATILSAQCTDARVNQVTPALFARYPTPAALAASTQEELEPQVQPTGFFRMKSRSLLGMSRAVMEKHGGRVPDDMESLVKLPGVGRKTANVVLGHAFHKPDCLSIATCSESLIGSASSIRTMRSRPKRSSHVNCRPIAGQSLRTLSSFTAGGSADPGRSAIGAR